MILRRSVQTTWFEDRVSVEREDGKWLPLDLGEDYNDDGEDYIIILIIMIMMWWWWCQGCWSTGHGKRFLNVLIINAFTDWWRQRPVWNGIFRDIWSQLWSKWQLSGNEVFIGHITSVEKIAAVANFRFQYIVEIHDLTSINYMSIFSRKFHISAWQLIWWHYYLAQIGKIIFSFLVF